MAWNFLDLYHRAFKSFKTELSYGDQDNKLRQEICNTVESVERLSATRFTCEIKTDWIEAIEQGLPFVEKAILENRQFILQQGETQMIEKARRVSKASVEHLSRHSELITREPAPGADLIPDKIYIVENDSNYAIYENRFLYMLLCELSAFIDIKCAKILEYWDKYTAKLMLKKKVELGKRKIDFLLDMTEESRSNRDDMDEETRLIMERIAEIGRQVGFLLQTSLMKDVSHAPKIKPPVTRTNILKMDQNFKAAVALYDFISSYVGDGFTLSEFHEDMENFVESIQEDFAELVTTASYLTRRYGAGQNDELEFRYQEENKRRRDEEDRRYREMLAQTRTKWQSGKISAEEYVSELEKRNRSLENDRNELSKTQAELYECSENLRNTIKQRNSLEKVTEDLQNQIVAIKQAMEDQASAFRIELRNQKIRYETELAEQKEHYEAELAELNEKYDALMQDFLVADAQVHTLRHELKLPDADLSTKEMLRELERERKAFEKLSRLQWKKAKKNIRKKEFAALKKKKTNTEVTQEDGNDTPNQ